MPADDAILKLMGRIYDAALEPGGWHSVFQSVCELTGRDAAAVLGAIEADSVDRVSGGSRLARIAARLAENGSEHAPENEELLSKLLPHIQRSIRLSVRLASMADRVDAMSDALDHSPMGLVLCDSGARIIHANRAASDMMAVRRGLRLHDGVLMARRAADTMALHDMIARLASGLTRRFESLTLSFEPGNKPYIVQVGCLRMKEARAVRLPGPGAVVLFSDPESAVMGRADRLAEMFQFTAAETRLAEHLVQGLRLEEIAHKRSVSINTIKTQLRSMFAKTETRRQTELISRLLKEPFVSPQ